MFSANHTVPAISGVLNNCGLHACVPAITAVINKLAVNDQEINQKLAPYFAEWNRLKDTFARFYKIDASQFTWQRFDNLLTTSIKDNQTAKQFVMGPVLREFMGQTAESKQMLHGKRIADGVTAKLGFQLVDYTFELIPEVHNPLKDLVTTINIYNTGQAHWELVPVHHQSKVVNDVESLLNANTALSKAFCAQSVQQLQFAVNQLSLAEMQSAPMEVEEVSPNGFGDLKEDLLKSYHENRLFVAESKRIVSYDALNKAEAERSSTGEQIESDEEFARRLQEAEIRLLFGKS